MTTAEETTKRGEGDKGVSAPSISLPKGGGAIRGMGEKFAANPVTGTGSMSVPLAVSPGRAGFGPQLSLSYDSGAGNGPFGFGWSLSLPSITRKTDKGLPRYDDANESDVVILSGAEDLVPLLNADGSRFKDTTTAPGFTIHRYRPRIEGLFARIERWTRADGDVHWRSISKDNILTLYGKDADSRIVDTGRIFSWLICESRDDKGNGIVYEYKPEDGIGVDLTQAHERNRGDRGDLRRSVGRYLKRIKYGNRVPLLDATGARPRMLASAALQNANWMFEVVFDYGEHDANAPQPSDDPAKSNSIDWPARNDPFSSYRAGFEVRTYRICQRVLMFHHIPDLPSGEKGYDGLVRSTDFTYYDEEKPAKARNPVYTFLHEVTQSGYKANTNGYLKRSLPPVVYEYTQPIVQDKVQDVDGASLENLPIGVDGAAYQWTDLHGEGIPGILTEQADAWFYKRNLSPISERPVEFAPAELVAANPNLALAGGAQFMDLAGDGQPDLVVLEGPMPGFYEHDGAEGWQPFRPFTSRLARDTRDPNLKFVDLDGDGHADVLISEDEVFVWHPSLAEQGFGPANRVRQALDEEKGPRLVFADGTQSVYLADLSGDGLTDLARIRNGEVCYWPNLGYGRFGAKVTMDNAPRFDNPDQFDQKRVRLADIDGSGTTDIIYLHRDGVRLHFNQSGNSWSAPVPLRVFPQVDDLVAIAATDLLGNGTACLVWSSPLPGDARRPMRYVNLMGEAKPHLLVKTINNLGAETRVTYAPSTKFYLKDKQAGRPWITRLPFPVHVVEKVTTYDHISRNRFVTRYAYHHGYFDGEEREFRGFGMVEQTDTEEFAAFTATGAPPSNADQVSHVPPVLTRTWFHTGVYLGRDRVSNYFAGLVDGSDRGEYYREPAWLDDDEEARKRLLPDTVLPSNLTLDEEREAARSLKGMMLRQEVYARDGVGVTSDYPNGQPYTVAEQNFTVRPLQPRDGNRHAVFFTHPREAITYHYEREPQDPRIQHALTLEVDDYGNVLKQAAIGYGRRMAATDPALLPEDHQKQRLIHITATENSHTNVIALPDAYRTPLPAEASTYELRRSQQDETGAGPITRYRFDDMLGFARQAGDGTHDIAYEDVDFARAAQAVAADPTEGPKYFRRLVERVRTRYRPDDCGAARNDPLALLAPGALEPLALPGESYKLAFTPGLLAQVFRRPHPGQPDETLLPDPAAVLGGHGADRGSYVDLDGDEHWWIPSGRAFYSDDLAHTATQELAQATAHFFLLRRYRDPFGYDALVDFDANDLLMVETRDALGNRVTVDANDYRVLQPRLVSDPNRNRTEVAFDALGLVAGTAVMGKPADNPPQGDNLDNLFQPDLTQTQIDDFVAQPRQPHPTEPASQATPIVHTLLGNATTRIVYDLDRFKTLGEPPFAATIARETHVGDLPAGQQSKLQVSFSYSDGFGREIQKKIQAEPGLLDVTAPQAPVVNPRWVGSGWTIFNNKGKPVRQYEPFFSATHHFEFGVRVGVSPVLFYDPVERAVATLHPNHTWEKVVFDPWRQETWDVNDTVLITDPKTDADVGNFFSRLPNSEYLPTWHALRTDAAHAAAFAVRYPDATDRTNETRAAAKASIHAATPTVAYADSLGRTFLTVAHNKAKYSDTPAAAPPIEEFHVTRIVLDIEGNQREVIDAKDRVVMRYDYDMLGNRIHQASMEAGKRWTLGDVAGKPLYAWDSRDHRFRTAYDPLRRPTDSFLREGGGAEMVVGRSVYGEGRPNPEASNLRGKVVELRDQAGVVTSDQYDFKGNLLRSQRQFAEFVDPQGTRVPAYKTTINWTGVVQLHAETYTSRTRYDALNRPISSTSPDGSIYRPTFNEANLLDKVEVNLQGAAAATSFVTDVDYDAKGQRKLIAYANGAQTDYDYDPLTFRLTNLKTTRPAGVNGLSTLFASPRVVQDLRYTYDPAGNITRIDDAALKTVNQDNQTVEPTCEYTYDAVYRLIEAQGREHIGQTAFDFNPLNGNRRDYPFAGLRASPNNPEALRRYTEQYVYDAVGNFQRTRHSAHGGSWTQSYVYDEDSLVVGETGKKSNRLTQTTVGNGFVEAYTHDPHGNMTSMNSMALTWDFEDQLQRVDLGGGGRAYYVYDAPGQRVRKVIENQNGVVQEERIYLGGYEVYRKHSNPNAGLERQTLHIMDDKQRIALAETRNGVDDGTPRQLIRYQFGNHLGSASLELDMQAQVISYEEYAPYGSSTYQAVRSQMETAKRYRYTGKERDGESGLYYHGARYYATWLGRWVSCDPLGTADSASLYAFVSDRPIVLVDETGNKGDTPKNQEQMSERFARQLNPVLRRRIDYVIQDLRDRGWHPTIPEVYDHYNKAGGVEVGTGYRSEDFQLRLRRERPEASGVTFSFHNVTEPLILSVDTSKMLERQELAMPGIQATRGRQHPSLGDFQLRSPIKQVGGVTWMEVPASMAVHVTDPSLRGRKLDVDDPFLVDLETAARRHGLFTGRKWKTPFDPLHVQLHPNKALGIVRSGNRPPVPGATLQLWAPSLSMHPRPGNIAPRSIENLMAGESFRLSMPDEEKLLHTRPNLGNFQLRMPKFEGDSGDSGQTENTSHGR